MKKQTFQSGKIYHIFYKGSFIDGYFSIQDGRKIMLTRFGEYQKIDFLNAAVSLFMLIEPTCLNAGNLPDFIPFEGWFEGSAIPERASNGVPSYLVP